MTNPPMRREETQSETARKEEVNAKQARAELEKPAAAGGINGVREAGAAKDRQGLDDL